VAIEPRHGPGLPPAHQART